MPEPAVPESAASGNPVPPGEVRAMFDHIAPRYDAMNTLITLGMDAGWRRRAVRAAELSRGMSALDVACGSGSLTRLLARAVGPGGTVTGVDISTGMLRVARGREPASGAAAPTYLEGDALDLPLPDASVDAATIAFGLRNVPDYRRCLIEMARVATPGGRVVVLEIATPAGRMERLLSATWFGRMVPLLGRLTGSAAAYRYLPDSVRGYPGPEGVADHMWAAGLVDVRWLRLAPGLVTLHVGLRS